MRVGRHEANIPRKGKPGAFALVVTSDYFARLKGAHARFRIAKRFHRDGVVRLVDVTAGVD
jgi:hypothetical protein